MTSSLVGSEMCIRDRDFGSTFDRYSMRIASRHTATSGRLWGLPIDPQGFLVDCGPISTGI
eukprot:12743304-Prorocentrum_lima.AAC.1